MDTKAFDLSIRDLTSSLGDPTRRAIYIAVRESPEPIPTSEVARLFGIHPNVARHHLDRLANDGYLQVSRRRPAGRAGPGAGRPAKTYESTQKPIDLHFPARRYDLLAELLTKVLNKVSLPDVSAVAEEVGREYGAQLAAEIGAPTEAGYDEAVTAVAKAMTGIGFEVSPDLARRRMLTSYCPFGEVATSHPEVVCSLDRGIVAGMMGVLKQPCDPVVIPHTNLVDDCVTEIPVSIGRR